MDFHVAYGGLSAPVRSELNQRAVDGVINGYVRVQDNPALPNHGHFVNRAGRVRFSGVNLFASGTRAAAKPHNSPWPRTAAEAKETADRLADLGINGVRVMRLINPAPVGLLNSTGTALDPAATALFVQFVRALKARNIYLTIAFWNGDDDFVPGHPDFPENGGQTAFGAIDPAFARILQKQMDLIFFMDMDPTKPGVQPLMADPVLALVEINNENSLFEAWSAGRIDGRTVSGGNKTEPNWTEKFWPGTQITYKARFLSAPGGSAYRSVFDGGRKIWTSTEPPQAEKDACVEWLGRLEASYNATMIGFVKSRAAACRGGGGNLPVTGGQICWGGPYADSGSFGQFDYHDDHLYYGAYNTMFTARDTLQRLMLLSGRAYGNYAVAASRRVKGKPYVVSEYGYRGPQLTLGDYTTLLAYGAAQDWDGMYCFAYENDNRAYGALDNPKPDGPVRIQGEELILSNPTALAAVAAGARLFRGNQIAPFSEDKFIKVRRSTLDSKVKAAPSANIAWDAYMGPLSFELALRYRIGVEVVPEKSAESIHKPIPDVWDPTKTFVLPDANRLVLYKNRFARFDAPLAKGYVGYYDDGFISRAAPAVFQGGISIAVDGGRLSYVCNGGSNAFVNITINSLNRQSLENWRQRQQILITALGQCRNDEADYNTTAFADNSQNPPVVYPPYTRITTYGSNRAKSQVDRIHGTVTFPVAYKPARFRFYECTNTGVPVQRTGANYILAGPGTTTIKLGDSCNAVWYYVDYDPTAP